ncbi:MAG: hypothetical protein JWN94_2328 [Betaproteobacteria bacterium]|nr:hypothetical protein [Betaproteobacteria bacterium]
MPAHFPELYRTALALHRRKKFRPLIVFTGDAGYASEISQCTSAGLEYVVSRGVYEAKLSVEQTAIKPDGEVTGSANEASGWRQRIKRLPLIGSLIIALRSLYLRCAVTRTAFIRLPWQIRRLYAFDEDAKNILRTTEPDAIVLPHVDLGGVLGCIAVESKRQKIPVIVIPYTWIFRDEIMKVLIGKAEYHTSGLINRWMSKKYPHWVFRDYFFLPPVKIAALEMSDLSTPNPWMADSIADMIALDSEVMLRSYLGDGVSAEKCRITGSAAQDILAPAASPAARAKTAAAFDVNPPFALSFLPPDQTPNQMAGFEFASYWEMLVCWIETATAHKSMRAVFSLHPRMKSLTAALAARFPQIEIFDGDACELIPHAKFCVGQFGGMMRYAMACAKPVLYYDVFAYDIGINEFTTMPSMVTVRNRAEFERTYARFADDALYVSSLEKSAVQHASKWGILDGCAVERIENLIATQLHAAGTLKTHPAVRSRANV